MLFISECVLIGFFLLFSFLHFFFCFVYFHSFLFSFLYCFSIFFFTSTSNFDLFFLSFLFFSFILPSLLLYVHFLFPFFSHSSFLFFYCLYLLFPLIFFLEQFSLFSIRFPLCFHLNSPPFHAVILNFISIHPPPLSLRPIFIVISLSYFVSFHLDIFSFIPDIIWIIKPFLFFHFLC